MERPVVAEMQEMLGTFNGKNFVNTDGKEYPIPQNYVSKSMLVEGDNLKLIITSDFEMKYKQIKPVERKKSMAKIMLKPDDNKLCAYSGGKYYSIQPASISFYQLEVGDDCIIILPKNNPDTLYCAIEHKMNI